MKYVILETGLFPDAGTVAAALDILRGENEIRTFVVAERDADASWDAIAEALAEADRIITL